MERIFVLIIGYLIGGFQTAIVLARTKNMDIRKHGSGNAGATNTLRVLGKKAAILVFLGDMLKAILAIVISRIIFKDQGLSPIIISLYSGIGAILGHNWPIYFQFKGGKGIAVSMATLAMIDYRIGLVSAALFIGSVYFTRYVSLGSILLTVSAPISFIILYKNTNSFSEGLFLIVLIPILAVYQHRGNIKRLLNGTESKLGEKNK